MCTRIETEESCTQGSYLCGVATNHSHVDLDEGRALVSALRSDDGVGEACDILRHTLIIHSLSDESLDIINRSVGEAGREVLCGGSDAALAGVGEVDVGGGGERTAVVGHHDDLVLLPHSDGAVGGSKIDSD